MMKDTIEEVVMNSTVKLSGTLTKPMSDRRKYPAALIIGGTGGLNRDGNGIGFKMNIYKRLAEALSDMGYITLRYDKRGVGRSEGDKNSCGVADLVEDVKACTQYLKHHPDVDENQVVLVGHSEGCILATLVTKEISVAGLILISGAGVSLRTSMEAQAAFLLEEATKMTGIKGLLLKLALTEKSVIGKQMKLFEKVTTSSADTMRIQGMKFPAKWLREHLAYTDDRILDSLGQLKIPILAVTGDKDVQTDYRNLTMLEALGNNNIQIVVINHMDHMLKMYDGKLSVLDVKKQYKKEMNDPMHPQLIELLTNWSNDFIQ